VLAYVLATAEPVPDLDIALLALAAGGAGTLGLFAFYRALAIGTMSVVAPISACGVALPVLVGVLGGDALTAVTAAGMAIAVAGAVLASREGPTDADSEVAPNRASILLALAAAVGFGTYFTLSDPVADESLPYLLLSARVLATVVLGAILLRTPPPRPGRRDVAPLVAAGVLDVGATALYGVALQEGALSVVSVVGSLYPVVTVLLARAILQERLHRLQAAGVVAAFAGIVLIAAGS
jgi:drug/metabolite transporter (DMT)-like permease